MTIGDRLKMLREQMKMTQSFISEKIGVAPSTLSGYENNFREPDLVNLTKLADLYDVSVDFLLGREYKKNQNNDGMTELEHKLLQMLIEKYIQIYGKYPY